MSRVESLAAAGLGVVLLILLVVGVGLLMTRPTTTVQPSSNAIATPTSKIVSVPNSQPIATPQPPSAATLKPGSTVSPMGVSVPSDMTPPRVTVIAQPTQAILPANHPANDGTKPCEACHSNLRGKGK